VSGWKKFYTMAQWQSRLMCNWVPIFRVTKGLDRGDPLSPLLFNMVADCLTQMVIRAQGNSRITGLISHLIPNGVAIL
jgi:hypothetical protein